MSWGVVQFSEGDHGFMERGRPAANRKHRDTHGLLLLPEPPEARRRGAAGRERARRREESEARARGRLAGAAALAASCAAEAQRADSNLKAARLRGAQRAGELAEGERHGKRAG